MTHPLAEKLLNGDGDSIASLADELANAKVQYLYEMPIVTVTLSKTNIDAIVAALRSADRLSERVRVLESALGRIDSHNDNPARYDAHIDGIIAATRPAKEPG